MFQKSEHMLRVSDEIEFALLEFAVEVFLTVDSSSVSGKVSSSSKIKSMQYSKLATIRNFL